MILQRLTQHYDRLIHTAAGKDLPQPGYSRQKIGFCIVLNPDGSLNQFQSLLSEDGRPKEMLVPGKTKPSGSGINPCFLWDNAAYMLGYKPDDDKPERTRRSFEAFRDKHLGLESACGEPQFKAVCTFLRGWSPDSIHEHCPDPDAVLEGFGVFRIAGEHRFVHEIVPHREESDGAAEEDEVYGTCLVTGQANMPIARLHEPKIKGVRGCQSAGGLVVSFNDPAYESFGKAQSYNAPVSKQSAFQYTNALNYVLALSDRRFQLGDATVIFWAEEPNPLEDVISDLFGADTRITETEEPEDRERLRQVRHFLSQLRDGTALAGAIDEKASTRFFILGLSPNNARISVRIWIDSTVGELKNRVLQHVQDLNLAGRNKDTVPSLWRIVAATGRAEFQNGKFKRFNTDAVSPLLAGALARAVLTGSAYPQALLTTMLGRIRADGEIHYVRCAAIKACLVRDSRVRGNLLEVPVALDLQKPEPAYNIGRLLLYWKKRRPIALKPTSTPRSRTATSRPQAPRPQSSFHGCCG